MALASRHLEAKVYGLRLRLEVPGLGLCLESRGVEYITVNGGCI